MTAQQAIALLQQRNNRYAQKHGINDYTRESEKIINALIELMNEKTLVAKSGGRNPFPFAESLFSVYDPPITNKIPEAECTVYHIYNYITKEEPLRKATELLRNTGDKSIKTKHLPYATFSGTFTQRHADCLKKHSQLIVIDFDHIGNETEINNLKKLLLKDKYFETMLMFRSPSGDGLKWLINIDTTRYTHKEWFEGIYWYIKKTYGHEIDKSGSDIARACFLCYDKNAFINPNLYR